MKKVVVCGTTFGQVYLEALARARDFELAGVVAKGSERSKACADYYGVPLFDDTDDVPGDVDIACVVVRSGLLGGKGSTLAERFLGRGISVLQEHPVHHDELARILRRARSTGAAYRLNSFYVHVPPVRRFLAAAGELLASHPALFVDAACGFQLAYALLDILDTVLHGVRPWRFGDAVSTRSAPFRSIDGIVGDVPLTLRVQNQLDPSDPDNHAHLMHRITIGTDVGNLTLVNTHGPVVWSARPRYPTKPRDDASTPHFRSEAGDFGEHSAVTLGPADGPTFAAMFGEMWPRSVLHALTELRDGISAPTTTAAHGQRHLSLCRLWQEISSRLGSPEHFRGGETGCLEASRLDMMRAAVDSVDGSELLAV